MVNYTIIKKSFLCLRRRIKQKNNDLFYKWLALSWININENIMIEFSEDFTIKLPKKK